MPFSTVKYVIFVRDNANAIANDERHGYFFNRSCIS